MTKGRYGVEVSTDEWRYFLGEDAVYNSLQAELGWGNVPPAGKRYRRFRGDEYHMRRQRITLTVERTTRTGTQSRSYQAQVWCVTDKLEDALQVLPGKQYKTDKIVDAYIKSGGLQVS